MMIELIKSKWVQPQQVTEKAVFLTYSQALLISASAVTIGSIVILFPALSNSIVGMIHKGTDVLLEKYRSKYPLTVDKLSNAVKGWHDKLLRYPSADATKEAAKKLREQSYSLKTKLSSLTKRRSLNIQGVRFVEAMTGVADNTTKVSNALQKISKSSDILLNIGKHAPLVGMAFAALIPILGAIEENFKVVSLVEESTNKINRLVTEICKLLKKVRGERIALNETERNELNTLFYTLEDGYSNIGSILQDRSKGFFNSFRKIGLHEKRLEVWNKTVDEMLKEGQREKMNMVFYRSRVVLELARAQILLQCFTIIIVVFGFSLVLKRLDEMDHVGHFLTYLETILKN